MLIVKVGETLPSLRARRGDFEHWILAGMQLDPKETLIVDVRNGGRLPEVDQLSGVVITGSHAMVTEHRAWSERTAEWLTQAVESEVPVLGICYGHQLLAYALGGEVGNNPQGREFGTVEVHLDGAARQDSLLGGLPNPIKAHVGHTQSVLRLPESARRLASSTMDANQAFVVGHCAWGVQFHPEFDAGVVRAYIAHFQDALRQEGHDPQRLMDTCLDTPFGPQILRRFVELVDQRAG